MSANSYVQGWREWDERYADLVLGKRNWQIAAGCCLLVSLALGIVWLALRSRYVCGARTFPMLLPAIAVGDPVN